MLRPSLSIVPFVTILAFAGLPAKAGPCQVQTVAGGINGRDVFVEDDRMYLLDRDYFQIYDIADRANPVLLGQFDGLFAGSRIKARGDTVFVTSRNTGLYIVDVSDPTNPAQLSNIDLSGIESAIVPHDNLLYVSSGSRLYTIDIADLANPVVLGFDRPTSYFMGELRIVGDLGFAPASHTGLIVFDLSDPRNPVELNAYETIDAASGLAVIGSVAYVACDFTAMEAVDISDPMNPVTLDTWQWTGNERMRDVETDGTSVYLMNTNYGMHVLDVTNPSDIRVQRNHRMVSASDTLYVAGDYAYIPADAPDGVTLYIESISGDCASCMPDLTGDGILDYFDVSQFLNDYFAGSLGADLDGDGQLTAFDVSMLVNSFLVGCE